MSRCDAHTTMGVGAGFPRPHRSDHEPGRGKPAPMLLRLIFKDHNLLLRGFSEDQSMFTPDKVQQQIVAGIRQFVERKVIPVARELERRDEYPHQVVEEMKEMGLF